MIIVDAKRNKHSKTHIEEPPATKLEALPSRMEDNKTPKANYQ